MGRRGDTKSKNDGRSKSGRGGGGGVREPLPRSVLVSKALSFLLRHGAKAEGVELDDGGWANVADVLRWRRLSALSVTLEELTTLVATNDKQRFAIKPDPNYDPLSRPSRSNQPTSTSASTGHFPDNDQTNLDPAAHLIRASQGHSLKDISSEKLLTRFTPAHPNFPGSGYVVHGTYNAAWSKILETGGLRPMGRRHIHFATELPPPLPPLDSTAPASATGVSPRSLRREMAAAIAIPPANPASNSTPAANENDNDLGSSGPKAPSGAEMSGDAGDACGDVVLSGMRRDASVLVWVDVTRSATEGGVEWWRSANGVVLTEGVDGVLGLEWIAWVERRGTEEVLWGTKPSAEEMEARRRSSRRRRKTTTTTRDPVAEEGAVEDGVGALKVDVDDDVNADGVGNKGSEIEKGKGKGREEMEVEKGEVKDNWDD